MFAREQGNPSASAETRLSEADTHFRESNILTNAQAKPGSLISRCRRNSLLSVPKSIHAHGVASGCRVWAQQAFTRC
jgi:hypothetical protein